MQLYKLRSWAKVNLSLNVIRRLPNKYHAIESLVTFLNIYDVIYIKLSSKKKHTISFFGPFAKGIKKSNTVSKLLNILERKKLFKNKKFEIRIKKNLPQKSGLGGGSMNAAFLLKYFTEKKIIHISKKKTLELAYKIGSDVILGLEKKNSVLLSNGILRRSNRKINYFVLVVKPKIGCSTKKIFSRINCFSKSNYNNKSLKYFFNEKNLIKSKNDLEDVVFKLYPVIKKLKVFLSKLPNVKFVRMTGSGSALVAYFKTKKTANSALRVFTGKYKNYWCIISKTI